MRVITDFLDSKLFPRIVAYVVHRAHIVALLLVGIMLMVSSDPLVQLKLGNYTNVCSALVACIVLLQQMAHHEENMAHHRHTHERLTTLEKGGGKDKKNDTLENEADPTE